MLGVLFCGARKQNLAALALLLPIFARHSSSCSALALNASRAIAVGVSPSTAFGMVAARCSLYCWCLQCGWLLGSRPLQICNISTGPRARSSVSSRPASEVRTVGSVRFPEHADPLFAVQSRPVEPAFHLGAGLQNDVCLQGNPGRQAVLCTLVQRVTAPFTI
eukprot:GHUV01029054.1.p2 GENE.GHUV01029054.1~~GHUV01029054.1.p2  ORF type:complete len:163 (-),score=4.20 GHUV01029054.1:18-506(-)